MVRLRYHRTSDVSRTALARLIMCPHSLIIAGVVVPAEIKLLEYRDVHGKIFGPFSSRKIYSWQRQSCLPGNLVIRYEP